MSNSYFIISIIKHTLHQRFQTTYTDTIHLREQYSIYTFIENLLKKPSDHFSGNLRGF